ncbi:NifB/NifX family molybdenum-iron cluster-binding protein [Propionicimonas sp.]|uniref:NifB/NifX family molybdenum-iron cluster-binding protein n=1 Tax=Propionicimonas sp. TaxID=1955623 RepID=UPI0017BC9B3D|nr:NifB/NifX family molybdenum-iron cluster-binding protein [Propionicimonas sp.]MBU3975875.1 NifB/NifX family molybdenum-iron cluster-binding protein [Actinomycetota bacterium]MBA3022138.1 dinitrogenase iron-molybdenum cofactor biosynthesis protein [Propionicimonas sp.]MBU3987425.1 NifB/NifX family molybdenum-iron cluster-binding protein [Actinomycetota bacterium]MBU4006630.1 NifB/NifX family molybdenum-iron cluster-binding protein [Actinomycetota bacterium]MBU4065235.1 NifB/NifX family molyb
MPLVVLPVDGSGPASKVSDSFGRAEAFWIYDTESDGHTEQPNRGLASPGGAGIKAAQQVVDAGAAVLLAPQLGENAAKILRSAGIALFHSRPGEPAANIAAHLAGELVPLNQTHPGQHGA